MSKWNHNLCHTPAGEVDSECAACHIAQQEKRIATMKTGLGQIKQIAELQPVDRAIYNIAEAALLPQQKESENE